MNLRSLFIIFFIICFGCKQHPKPEIISISTNNSSISVERTQTQPLNYVNATLTIKGMSCEVGCAKTIEKKLANLDGVNKAKVNFKKEIATIEFDKTKIDNALLISTVNSIGDNETYEVIKLEILSN